MIILVASSAGKRNLYAHPYDTLFGGRIENVQKYNRRRESRQTKKKKGEIR